MNLYHLNNYLIATTSVLALAAETTLLARNVLAFSIASTLNLAPARRLPYALTVRFARTATTTRVAART